MLELFKQLRAISQYRFEGLYPNFAVQLACGVVLQSHFGDGAERAERDFCCGSDIGIFFGDTGQNFAIGRHQFDLCGVVVHGTGIFAGAVG